MADNPLRLKSIHHVELWVGNAKQAAFYYRQAFGFSQVAYAGLETGRRDAASYALQQGKVRLVLTTPFAPDDPIAAHVARHGDGVTRHRVPRRRRRPGLPRGGGAWRGAGEPSPATWRRARRRAPRRHRHLRRHDPLADLVPATTRARSCRASSSARAAARDAGLLRIDHMVGNVELGRMNEWADWYSRVLGFSPLHQLRRQGHLDRVLAR